MHTQNYLELLSMLQNEFGLFDSFRLPGPQSLWFCDIGRICLGCRALQKMILSQDIGKTLNPNIVRGQLKGTFMMGIRYAYALTEEFVMSKGFNKTNRFSDCGIPIIDMVPENIDVALIEKPEPHGPFELKGISEAALVQAAPAITNAIFNTTGIWLNTMPVKGKIYLPDKEFSE